MDQNLEVLHEEYLVRHEKHPYVLHARNGTRASDSEQVPSLSRDFRRSCKHSMGKRYYYWPQKSRLSSSI